MSQPSDDDDRWLPAAKVSNYNSERFDIHWNDNFSKFIPLKLTWWDDASYIAYQCGDPVESEPIDYKCYTAVVNCTRVQRAWNTVTTESDNLPF